MHNFNLTGSQQNPVNNLTLVSPLYEDFSRSSSLLIQQLQTSLELDKIIEIFAIEATKFVDFCGLSFTSNGISQIMKNSRKGKIQHNYKLTIDGAPLATIHYSTNTMFSPTAENTLNRLHKILRYPLRNAIMYKTVLQQALNDSLTGLGNRREFDQQINRAINQAQRKLSQLTLVLLDLNKFKAINDTYGHNTGDNVLSHFAKALQHSVREADSVFRLGGDEFAILIEDSSKDSLIAIENRLHQAITRDALLMKYQVGFSMGFSHLTEQDTPATLMIRADKKLYQDKFSTPHSVENIA